MPEEPNNPEQTPQGGAPAQGAPSGTAPTPPAQTPPVAAPTPAAAPAEDLTPDKARKLVEQANKDAAKWRTKYRAMEEQMKAGTLPANQDLQRLYIESQSKLQEAQERLAELEAEATTLRPIREAQTQAEQATRAQILEQIPEELRPNLESLPTETLRALAARFAAPGSSPAGTHKPPVDPARTPGGPNEDKGAAGVPFSSGLGDAFTMLQQNKG